MALFPALKQWLQRMLRRGPAEPQDPYARVPVPVRRGPGGRSSAVAVEEPPEPQQTNASGRWRARDK